MATESILDRLVTEISFREDRRAIGRINRAVDRLRGKMRSMGNQSLLAGTAITAVAVKTLTSFAKYETQMAKIEGLVGISRDQIQAWQADIRAIAKETGKGPTELADALFFLASAGLRGSDAIDVLRKTAKAATSGLGDQMTIANLLTSTLDVYGKENLDAGTATNQLIAAIREGKLDPESLAGPLANVLPFAKEAGVEFGEVAGMMAAMSRKGIDAKRSATALRGIFAKLAKPTEGGKKALEEAGLSMEYIRDVISNRGLVTGLDIIRKKLKGDSEALGKVFEDVEALLGVLVLSGDNLKGNQKIISSVVRDTGAMDHAFESVSKTLEFRFNRFMARSGFAVIDLGKSLRQSGLSFLQFANSALDWFNSLSPGMKTTIGQVLILGPLLLGLGSGLRVLSFALGGFVPVLKLLGGGLKIVSLAFGVLGKAALFNPIILAITAIAIGAYLIYRNWDGIVDFFRFIWAGARKAFDKNGILGVIQWVWNAVVTWLHGFSIKEAVKGIWDVALRELFKDVDSVKNWMKEMWQRAKDWVLGFEISREVRGIWEHAWRNLWLDVNEVKEWMQEMWNRTVNWLEGFSLFESGKRILMTMGDGIMAAKDAVIGSIKNVFGEMWKWFAKSDAEVGPLSRLTQSGMAIIETLAAGIRKAGISPVMGAMTPALLMALPALNAPLPVPSAGAVANAPQAAVNGARNIDINVGGITISAPSGDPQEILSTIDQSLERVIRIAADQFDSMIER